MNTSELVDGGADGLRRVAELVREAGIPVEAAYLIKQTAEDGSVSWNLRVVTPERSLKVIQTIVALRRDSRLPRIDPQVGIQGVTADNVEASRVLAYAKRAFERPVEIISTPIDGLFVEYALVADVPAASDRAAA